MSAFRPKAGTTKPRLLWKLYPSYLLIVLLCLLPMVWYATDVMEKLAVERTVAELSAQCALLTEIFRGRISTQDPEQLRQETKKLAARMSSRLTVMLMSGKVVGDSHENPARMDDHSTRDEVKQALAGKLGIAERYSATLGKRMLYVAVVVKSEGKPDGIIRTSMPVAEMSRMLRDSYLEIAACGLVVALVAALLSYLVARRINKPIVEMKGVALKFAEGDLSGRIGPFETEEIAALADTMNAMAGQLDDRINMVLKQRNELETVLTHMVEGVLVVDGDERVVKINKAAAEIFQTDATEAAGKDVMELVRNLQFRDFVRRTLTGGGPLREDLAILGTPDRFFQMHGARLAAVSGEQPNALIVLEDVTLLKETERIRSDFVSNASHELRTPATLIKGFVETLRDGAVEDPKLARQFLEIIEKHVSRLIVLIEDLMTFDSITRMTEVDEQDWAATPIKLFLDNVTQLCSDAAAEKEVEIHIQCDEDFTVNFDRELMSQALVQLLQNAIQSSSPQSSVKLVATESDSHIVFIVADEGAGISKQHVNRIFERFYRTDRARTRQDGGAGLGLALVKHIVRAHNGRIEVMSSQGTGSTFTIRLPKRIWKDADN